MMILCGIPSPRPDLCAELNRPSQALIPPFLSNVTKATDLRLHSAVERTLGDKRVCIRVYTSKVVKRGDLNAGLIPMTLEGVPVEIVVTGEMRALEND